SFLDEYEDFQLQEYESPWGNAYRIIAPRKNLQLAFADTKDAIINDWKIIESNYQKEVLKTSTECMSGEYFKNFFKKLWQEEKMKEAAHSGESNNPSSLVQSHDADEFLLLPSPRESGRVLEAVATGGEAKEINAIIEEEGEQSIHFQDSFGRTALHIAAEM